MVSLKVLYSDTVQRLRDGKVSGAQFEAMCMLTDICGTDKNDVIFGKEADISKPILDKLNVAVKKRSQGEPLQYLLGKWEFYGMPFFVGKGVLIPRQDTETIVDAALESAKDNFVCVDLCSGSGCIAAALKKNKPDMSIYAVELSDDACCYFEKNMELNKTDVTLIKGDVCDKEILNKIPQCDLIVSNPPYLTKYDMEHLQNEVRYEPETALYGGDDGLDMYRKITNLWKDKLNHGGTLIYEIGIGQEREVGKIMLENGFYDIIGKKDLNGIVRAVIGIRK